MKNTEKARQSYEGLEPYETGYTRGFESGVLMSMNIMSSWLDTAYKITSDKNEFYNFMKDTFSLNK